MVSSMKISCFLIMFQEENMLILIATNLFIVVSSEDLTCLWLRVLCRGLFSFALYK